MNKIDIILIYLIIIIYFVCIIKIYLNNKNIEKFYSFNKQFSGVMRFIDENKTTYLGSYPDYWKDCFINDNKTCHYDDVKYIYDSSKNKIRIQNSTDLDKVIDVTNIILPKGDKGNNGSDATMPPISFYYINKDGQHINEEDGSIIPVRETEEESHKPFFKVSGDDDKDEIKVYVTRHENCTQQSCEECKGDVEIDSIKGITATADNATAVNVTGDITTNNIILQQDGKICINYESDDNCLTYNDISKLINWRTEFNQCVTP